MATAASVAAAAFNERSLLKRSLRRVKAARQRRAWETRLKRRRVEGRLAKRASAPAKDRKGLTFRSSWLPDDDMRARVSREGPRQPYCRADRRNANRRRSSVSWLSSLSAAADAAAASALACSTASPSSRVACALSASTSAKSFFSRSVNRCARASSSKVESQAGSLRTDTSCRASPTKSHALLALCMAANAATSPPNRLNKSRATALCASPCHERSNGSVSSAPAAAAAPLIAALVGLVGRGTTKSPRPSGASGCPENASASASHEVDGDREEAE
mmetsp:Transcript_61399/g.120529  ORF Transcript_61399/g.120529 Transcript_61399/m.120529 type:complete len:276 (-) Transcript_61399:322-1149(-)